jgi:hypothetical protein
VDSLGAGLNPDNFSRNALGFANVALCLIKRNAD